MSSDYKIHVLKFWLKEEKLLTINQENHKIILSFFQLDQMIYFISTVNTIEGLYI